MPKGSALLRSCWESSKGLGTAPEVPPERCPRARHCSGVVGRAPEPFGTAPEVHLWNNELHNEEIAHCEKLIVNNEPHLAHYWNNELGSLCRKVQ